LNVVNQSVVASPLIAYKTDMIVSGNYKAAASLAMLKKDLDLLLKTSATSLPLNSHIHEIYQSAVDHGLGEEDFFVLVREAQSAGEKL
jgi:3-hydroxyisobutyrate dehydrogenase-like beta-hydroxyacid dehydrogenase